MAKTLTKGLFLLALLGTGISLPAPVLAQSSIEGRVLEQGSNKPLANVVVAMVWAGSTGGEGFCLHSAAALTDANGYYRIPEWRHRARMGRAQVVPTVAAYLAGYREAPSQRANRLYLTPDPANKADRLQTLNRWRTVAACANTFGGERRPSPLPSALLEEAKTLLDEHSEPEKLEPFLFDVEVQRFGEEVAKQRQEQRLEKAE